MEERCREALKQAKKKHYQAEFEKGYADIVAYGIAFNEKIV